MNKSRAVGRLQNLLMLLLTLSAVLLLARIPLFGGAGWTSRIQSLLTVSPNGGSSSTAVLTGAVASAHLVVTGDSEYGRYGQLYADSSSLQQISPLFQEALGSATMVGAAADKTLQTALQSPNLYLDLTTELPLSVVAAWLGDETELERNIRSMALTTESEDTASLYLLDTDGSILRYSTALPVSAVAELVGTFAPNGASFAFESNYSPLSPYTVLVAQLPPVMDIQSELPAGYTDFNLLTALDFNAHTNARYPESDGTEVIVESPRTLRLSPDGTVSCSCDREVSAALYQIPSAAESPTVVEALQAANRIAEALTTGTGASSLFLRSTEPIEGGFQISFSYHAEGLPVFFPDDSSALTVITQGQAITSFVYRCRSYTVTEQTSDLLPPEMAIAIASLTPGAELSAGYVDSGSGPLSARWLVS